MPNVLHRSVLAASALALLATTAAPLAAAEAYGSRDEVQPLLLGSEVPSVEVLTLDGTAVDLKSVIGDKKAMVIFYRGGW